MELPDRLKPLYYDPFNHQWTTEMPVDPSNVDDKETTNKVIASNISERPLFELSLREVVMNLNTLGMNIPPVPSSFPEFILEMSLSQILDFAKSVTFADLQKMIPEGLMDQFKSKLDTMDSDQVTQQIKDLIQQVH